MLITFEGIDGSGKTTLSQELYRFLKLKGFKVHIFREPGGTPAGEYIRSLLLEEELNERAELLLFEASRAELVSTKVMPALERGEIVILDRFTDSTLAYQGFGRGIDIEYIRELNSFASFGIKPDLTFLLDLEPSLAVARVKEKSKFDNVGFLKKVREGFLKLASEDRGRFVVLDASRERDEVLSDVVKALRGKLGF